MSIIEQSALYKDKYGSWAGDPAGQKPDHSRCCQEVSDRGCWSRFYQCTKKRGHGPDGAYCKQHDPDIVKARGAASAARSRDKWNERRYEWYGKKFFNALVKIAEGHNDARELAQEVIAEFKKDEAA